MVLALGMSSPLSTIDFAGAHLPVRADEPDLGHVLVQPIGDLLHVGDARHDDEALPAAMMFAQQRLAHHHVVPFHHIGSHRQAIDRRRLDGRQLAQPAHRHLQGARDRRGSEREDVNVGAKLLELLLMLDAEPLLFINDNKAKPLELGTLAEDCVGADHDVHRPAFERLARLAHFRRRHQPRETANF